MSSFYDKEIPVDGKKLPPWFKQDIPDMNVIRRMEKIFRETGLNTVCQGAKCPNLGKCWQNGIATFMILGNICTRSCRFCAVRTGTPIGISRNEPHQIALAVKNLNLKYVVITSVTRDDLKDQGASQFVKTIEEIRAISPETKIEILIPDFSLRENILTKVVKAAPDVIGHNIETVESLFYEVRPQAGYEKSLNVLKNIRFLDSSIVIKSGFMVGLGETNEEIEDLMQDLMEYKCEVLTIGQYLAPTAFDRHVKVKRFVTPVEFLQYEHVGYKMGFKHVMSGPLVRSSYLAECSFMCVSRAKSKECEEAAS